MSEWLTTCISGSFKFKPEIDALHEAFTDHQVTVLEPTRGWLWIPHTPPTPRSKDSFRPLPAEVGMGIVEVQHRFFAAVTKADFMYFHNAEGYIGESMGGEFEHARVLHKPIFCKEPIKRTDISGNLGNYLMFLESIVVATPAEAATIVREGTFDDHLIDIDDPLRLPIPVTPADKEYYKELYRLSIKGDYI